MIAEPLVPAYQALLVRYLHAETELAREAALLAVDELARQLLPAQASMDDSLALHGRATARLARAWDGAPVGSPEHAGLQRLARGEVIPVMLALLLPQQVDEHRRAERRWQAEHARLAAVFEQTDDLVVMFEAGGAIEYLNPAFSRATGWTLATAQAEPARAWQTPLPTDGTRYLEAEQPRVDGSRFPASWSVSPVWDAEGRLLNHVAIGRDITAQRRYDDALRQNDRLRAVTTLAAGVAHDFNNLLGSIQGLTEVCQALTAPGTVVARNLDGIHGASLRAAELVAQLMSFARERAPQRQVFEVAPWLHGLESLLTAALPRHVQLRLEAAPGLQVDGDAGLLEQVLLNLVKNAGYAMREHGGPMTLRAAPWRDATGHAGVQLEVEDAGTGIPPDVLPRIFDPFFTTKPVGEGTGLGLSAAYGIVRQHQGELQVHSTPGHGTTFTLRLPAVAPTATTPGLI